MLTGNVRALPGTPHGTAWFSASLPVHLSTMQGSPFRGRPEVGGMRCVAFPWIYLWGLGGDTKWCSNVNWHSTLHRLVFCKLTLYTLLGVVQQSSPCHPPPPQQHPVMTWTSQRSLPRKAVWKYFICRFGGRMSASPTKAAAAAVTGGGGKVRDTALLPT